MQTGFHSQFPTDDLHIASDKECFQIVFKYLIIVKTKYTVITGMYCVFFYAMQCILLDNSNSIHPLKMQGVLFIKLPGVPCSSFI